MVKVLNKRDDVVFTRETTYVQHLLSVEKSMYQIMSEEMLRMFAGVAAFNNLVGDPINRYRSKYKQLQKLKEIFFEEVENEPDLEKFIEFYKWVDDAVTIMIQQLIPISSNTTEMLRNMIESHILERNKYWTEFPTMEMKTPEIFSSLKGIKELKYNWRLGHAPVVPEQNTNQDVSCLWWKERAERSGALSSGDSNLDTNKDSMLKILITEVSASDPTYKTPAGARYYRSYYYNRSLARPIDFVSHRSIKLKGGANSEDNKKHDFYKCIYNETPKGASRTIGTILDNPQYKPLGPKDEGWVGVCGTRKPEIAMRFKTVVSNGVKEKVPQCFNGTSNQTGRMDMSRFLQSNGTPFGGNIESQSADQGFTNVAYDVGR